MARKGKTEIIVDRPFSAGSGTHYDKGDRVTGDPQVLARLVGMRKAHYPRPEDDIGAPDVTSKRATRDRPRV